MEYYIHRNTKSKLYYRSIGNSLGELPVGTVTTDEAIGPEEVEALIEGYTKARCLAHFRNPNLKTGKNTYKM